MPKVMGPETLVLQSKPSEPRKIGRLSTTNTFQEQLTMSGYELHGNNILGDELKW